MDIIIASNNIGKIKEFKELLTPLGYNVLSQSEAGINIEVDETGNTFEENAILKAKAIYNIKNGCCSVISDDSGLKVEYLNGEPGIYSARYKGLKTPDERRHFILEKLKDVPTKERNAEFVCCICYINLNGNLKTFEGIWKGKITKEEMGNNGFGYDSIFMPEGECITSAQMSDKEKNSKSHRAKALKKLLENL